MQQRLQKSITWVPTHAQPYFLPPSCLSHTLALLSRRAAVPGPVLCLLQGQPFPLAEPGSWGRVPAPYPCHHSSAPLQPPGCQKEPEQLRQELLFIPQGLMSSTGEHNGEQQQQPDYRGVFLEHAGGVAEPFFPQQRVFITALSSPSRTHTVG